MASENCDGCLTKMKWIEELQVKFEELLDRHIELQVECKILEQRVKEFTCGTDQEGS